MQWSLSWSIIYCIFLGSVWKAIGWCGKMHGCHDILWGYPLEKKVSRIVNISSNQLTNEITYTNCYVKLCFTTIQKVMHLNHDGLFLNIEKNAPIFSTSYGCALWYGCELHILWTMAPRLYNGNRTKKLPYGLEVGALVATLLL